MIPFYPCALALYMTIMDYVPGGSLGCNSLSKLGVRDDPFRGSFLQP
jgi:hypothetical protein